MARYQTPAAQVQYGTPRMPDAPRRDPNTSSKPFNSSVVAVAVDVSGSTYGDVLLEEVNAIQSIYRQLSPRCQNELKVLPWSDKAEPVIGISSLEELDAFGNTNPTVLLSSRAPRTVLLKTSLWFLLTDGDIDAKSLKTFAESLSEHKMHGTACVTVIFGETLSSPSDCNITVGLSVFAMAPDCLFLYHDVTRHITHILQSKGCFNTLVRGRPEGLILDETTTWEDLPRFSYEDLNRVRIPVPRHIEKNEIALRDGLTVDWDDLWQDRLPRDIVDKIIDDDENLRSILLSATVRGLAGTFQRWVVRQQSEIGDPIFMVRPDIEGRAYQAVKQILHALEENVEAEEVQKLQRNLQGAHRQNLAMFRALASEMQIRSDERNSRVSSAETRSASIEDYEHLRSASSITSPLPTRYEARPSNPPAMRTSDRDFPEYFPLPDPRPSAQRGSRPEPKTVDIAKSSPSPQNYTRDTRQEAQLLYTKGFKDVAARGKVFGRCNICDSEEYTLAILLRSPPVDAQTPDFPLVGSQSKQAFPLALGNFPETDIISPFVCCEPCSSFVVLHGSIPGNERIVGALPLVPQSMNETSWAQVVIRALQSRFHQDDVLLTFLGILYNTLDEISDSTSTHDKTFAAILKWACNDIITAHANELTLDERYMGITVSLPDFFVNGFRQHSMSQQQYSEEACRQFILSYPMDGFIVLSRAASDFNGEHRTASVAGIEHTVFERFLLHLVEQYHDSIGTNGLSETLTKVVKLLPKNDRMHSLTNQLSNTVLTRDLLDKGNVKPKKPPVFSRPTTIARIPLGSSAPSTSKAPPTKYEQSLETFVEHLVGSCLLSEDDMFSFQRCSAPFEHIENLYGPAVAVFVHFLVRTPPSDMLPVEHYKTVLQQAQMQFFKVITVQDASIIIASLSPLKQEAENNEQKSIASTSE